MKPLQTQSTDDNPEAALTSFGFTDLESRLYCELLRNAPATGYRLSQVIGKAPANIYQALQSLLQKGAIFTGSSPDDAKSYNPVPPDELFSGLRQTFVKRHDSALSVLQSMHEPDTREQVYTLRTATQVLERARSMMATAQNVLLFDFFPEIYVLLRPELDAARARGVGVFGIAYRPGDVTIGMPFSTESANFVSDRWPGLGLILVKDGAEHMIAQLSRDMDQVLNGMWTDSRFMSCVFHSAVASDIRLVALLADPSDPLRGISLQNSLPPGIMTLFSNGSGGDTGTRAAP